MPAYFGKLSQRDLIEKAKNSFDAEDAQMYLDATEGLVAPTNPDEADLDPDDFA